MLLCPAFLWCIRTAVLGAEGSHWRQLGFGERKEEMSWQGDVGDGSPGLDASTASGHLSAFSPRVPSGPALGPARGFRGPAPPPRASLAVCLCLPQGRCCSRPQRPTQELRPASHGEGRGSRGVNPGHWALGPVLLTTASSCPLESAVRSLLLEGRRGGEGSEQPTWLSSATAPGTPNCALLLHLVFSS